MNSLCSLSFKSVLIWLVCFSFPIEILSKSKKLLKLESGQLVLFQLHQNARPWPPACTGLHPLLHKAGSGLKTQAPVITTIQWLYKQYKHPQILKTVRVKAWQIRPVGKNSNKAFQDMYPSVQSQVFLVGPPFAVHLHGWRHGERCHTVCSYRTL